MKEKLQLTNGETWERITKRNAKKRFISGETLIMFSPLGNSRIWATTKTRGCRQGEFDQYSFVKKFFGRVA